MAKYSKSSQKPFRDEMHESKLKSEETSKKVRIPKQAIATGLSEAREKGGKLPKKSAAKSLVKKSSGKK
ncbi:MAG: DUF6496 domain-containing protein [Ginsengibacter sp.]